MRAFENINTGKSILREKARDLEITYDGKVMIVEIDNKGHIIYTNRKFRAMTGYNREELEGLPFDISHHPDMPYGICQQALDAASDGKIWAGYIKSITRFGEFFWVLACVQAKYDTSKNIVGYIINKKLAEDSIIQEVKEEYAIFKDSDKPLFRSKYCGQLY